MCILTKKKKKGVFRGFLGTVYLYPSFRWMESIARERQPPGNPLSLAAKESSQKTAAVSTQRTRDQGAARPLDSQRRRSQRARAKRKQYYFSFLTPAPLCSVLKIPGVPPNPRCRKQKSVGAGHARLCHYRPCIFCPVREWGLDPPRPTAAANRKAPPACFAATSPVRGRLTVEKMCVHPLAPLQGAPPAGGGGENCTAARNISGYGKFSPSASAGNRSRRGRFFDTPRLFLASLRPRKKHRFLQNLLHRQHIPVHAEPYLILPRNPACTPAPGRAGRRAEVVFQHTGQSGALVFRHFAQKRVRGKPPAKRIPLSCP